jgi:hypothetical protein
LHCDSFAIACENPRYVTASWNEVTGVDGYNVYYDDGVAGMLYTEELFLPVRVESKWDVKVNIIVRPVYKDIPSPEGAAVEVDTGNACVSFVDDVYPPWKDLVTDESPDDGCSSCHSAAGETPGITNSRNCSVAVYDAIVTDYITGNDIYCLTSTTKKGGGTCSSSMDSSLMATDSDMINQWIDEGKLHNCDAGGSKEECATNPGVCP